ncbi:MAG: DUF86 domain-containing protein [Deltaproteobacteria bacterium]|nr:DUF86 domain-containing protein [Deltaproteobacteria bacterium]MBI4224363.1 DUF86 domain-containing protein [Deltaproteobacteria bacterium]
MSRDYRVYLDDILQAIRQIYKYTEGMDFGSFNKDDKTFDAVVKNLEVIGEAAKNIPESVRVKSKDVEWQKIAGLRDILVHEYFGIDVEIVWDIVKNKLPTLQNQLETILSQK